MNPLVIVGSGLAGYSVAREFRKRNKTDPIVIVTAEDGHFYSKPALSEVFRSCTPVSELVARQAHEMAAQIKGEIRTGVHAKRINTSSRELDTTEGTIHYNKLVLALGAEPVRLTFDDSVQDRILSVNDLSDYYRFRSAIAGLRTIAVLGAGLIGCEFANDLAHAGHCVKMIDIATSPLARLVPVQNGLFLKEKLQSLGVEWHLGTAVSAIERTKSGVKIFCADGTDLEADIVLSAIGLKPRRSLAEQSKIQTNHGIVVDRTLRTSDPNVFAIGDCAEIDRLWLPYISPITITAKVVAENLNGGAATARIPALPIIVKTSACPTVASPPAAGVSGRWKIDADATGIQSLFIDETGELQGFALSGSTSSRADELLRMMPALLEAQSDTQGQRCNVLD